jgi:pimeloyl-ACP methyl ester carboxylesterase
MLDLDSMPRSSPRPAPRRTVALTAALVLTTGAAGCPRGNGGASGGAAAGRGSTSGATDGAAGWRLPATQRVLLHTDDGWTLAGDLTPSGDVGAVDHDVTVLFVHQLASNRREWAPLVARVRAAHPSWTLLTLDLRGHGESTQGPDGPTSWARFANDAAKWAGLVTDVRAGADYLRGQVYQPRVFVVGSSIGSSATIRYASDPSSGVNGVVLISPGLAYHGLTTLPSLEAYARSNRPALLIASDGDTDSAAAVHAMASGPAQGHPGIRTEIYPGTGAHGVSIGAAGVHPELVDRVVQTLEDWVRPHDATSAVDATAGTRGDGASRVEGGGAELDSAIGGG